MSWLSRDKAAESEACSIGGALGKEAAKGAHEAMISDCGFGHRSHHQKAAATLPDVIAAPRPRYHEGMVPPVIREGGTQNKGYIDCGWGRLLDYNKRHEHTKLGMELLGRKPLED